MVSEITTVSVGYSFLEGPRWRDGRIWFSDLYTHRVLSAQEDGTAVRVEVELTDQPSGLGWLPDGRLLVVSMQDRKVLRREVDGTMVTHADLAEHTSGWLNDMVVDARGRAFVGHFGFDLFAGEPLTPSTLIRVDPNGSFTTVATDVWFPNGCVVTDDDVLLLSESLGNRITSFDLASDGSLRNRRTWARFGEPTGERDVAKAIDAMDVAADGCVLDAEGALWVADFGGGRVVRVLDGEIVDEVRPGARVFACALGGSDGRTLFLCTAPDFDPQARKGERGAELLSVRVDVPYAKGHRDNAESDSAAI